MGILGTIMAASYYYYASQYIIFIFLKVYTEGEWCHMEKCSLEVPLRWGVNCIIDTGF